MKNFFIKLVTTFVMITLFGCSHKIINNSRPLEFHNGSQSILINVIDDTNQLKLNVETKVNVNVKNIDPHALSFSGDGVRLSSSPYSDQTISLLIQPTKKNIVKNNLALTISYTDNGKIIIYKFLIPIKK